MAHTPISSGGGDFPVGQTTGPKAAIQLPGGYTGIRPHTHGPSQLPWWWGINQAQAAANANQSSNVLPRKLPISNAIAPDQYLPVCYGKVRVGGTELFLSTKYDGDEGFGVIPFCEGEIEAIDTFYCNGQPFVASTSADGFRVFTNYLGAPGDYQQNGAYPEPFNGKDVTNFTNVAYTFFHIIDYRLYGVWWSWLPNTGTYEWAADVRGLKLYDPRQDSTNGGSGTQRYTDPTTWTYSNNPALIFRDMVRRFGKAVDAMIDDVSIAVAATACDTAGFTCNIAFTTKTDLLTALAPVLQTCNGIQITTNEGRIGLYLDLPNAGSPVATFSEEDGDIWGLTYEWLSARNRYTRVAVSFLDSAANYKQSQTDNFDDPGIALGTCPIKSQIVNAPGINTMAAAVILRNYLFKTQAITFRVSGTMNAKGLTLQEGMKIHLTTVKVDADFLLNPIATDDKGFFQFVAQPYDATVWDTTPLSTPPPITAPPPPNPMLGGNDVVVTDATGERQVVASTASNQTVYDVFQLITYTLPALGPQISELRVRGFSGTGALTKTWDDMLASEIAVPLAGNESPADATHSVLSNSGVIKTAKTLTFDAFGRLTNTTNVTGPTRIIIKTKTTANALSTGVTVDVAASSSSVDVGFGPADTGQGTMIVTPAGVINGMNRLFTLPKTPSSSRILLISDAMPLRGGIDFKRVGPAITFGWTANKPQASLLSIFNYGMPDDGGGAVGGSGGPEATLPTGTAVTWTAGTIAGKSWKSVAFSPTLGMLAAVCSDGTSDAIATSVDGGATWQTPTIPTSPQNGNWASICWGNGCFVVTDFYQYTLTSSDGATWVQHAITVPAWPGLESWGPIAYASSLGIYAAVRSGTYGRTTNSGYSTDAISWTQATSANTPWADICFAPELGIFCAVGVGYSMISADGGATWTSDAAANGAFSGVCWSPALMLFVAAGTFTGGKAISTSPNGRTWTVKAGLAFGTLGYGNVRWSESKQLLIAGSFDVSTSAISTSPDAATWTPRTTPSCHAEVIGVADTIDLIVALSSSGTAIRCAA
jgi:hypothetical protein